MVLQCVWMMEVISVALKVPEVSQLGSWLYHTQLCPVKALKTCTKQISVRMPTSYDLIVSLSEINNDLSLGEIEDTLRWLRRILAQYVSH